MLKELPTEIRNKTLKAGKKNKAYLEIIVVGKLAYTGTM